MKKEIEEKIHREVQNQLDEIDWDAIVPTPKELKKIVGKEIDSRIKESIADAIANRIALEVKKKMPIIDAWVANKIEAIYHRINEL